MVAGQRHDALVTASAARPWRPMCVTISSTSRHLFAFSKPCSPALKLVTDLPMVLR